VAPNERLTEVKRKNGPQPGDRNGRGLVLIARTKEPSPNHGAALVWLVKCPSCRLEIRINGCDFHERRCPNHDGGAAGLA
jgi:hypothetical protein